MGTAAAEPTADSATPEETAAPTSQEHWPRTTSEVEPRVTPQTLDGDGVYGRFDGDLDLGVGVGAQLSGEPAPLLRASAHVFSSAGVVVHYSDRLGLDSEEGDRALGVAGELRPLFLPRWALALEEGPAWLDLTVDSLSIGAGYYWQNIGNRAGGDARGLELSAGLGVPLTGEAAGLWLRTRGQLRFGGDDTEPSLFLLLTWQSLIVSPWIAQ